MTTGLMLTAGGSKPGEASGIGEWLAGFSNVDNQKIARALAHIESAKFPEILLLQNASPNLQPAAVTVVSSVWSTGYSALNLPWGKVHRDFHYQMFFCGIGMLVEAGCRKIQVERLMPGHAWRRDAYICLREAVSTIQRLIDPDIEFFLRKGTYQPDMIEEVDAHLESFGFHSHRPIGIHPHLFEGLNMRRVVVERAEIAIANSPPTSRMSLSVGRPSGSGEPS